MSDSFLISINRVLIKLIIGLSKEKHKTFNALHHSFVVQNQKSSFRITTRFHNILPTDVYEQSFTKQRRKKISLRDWDMNNRIREFINIHYVAWNPA